MKVEGASQQSTSYQKPITNKVTDNQQSRQPELKSSLDIKNHTKRNLGYEPTIQEKLIIEAIEQANQKVLGPNKEFEFSIHKKTKQIMVKVLDSSTKEVLREIPPEKVLDAVAHMCELAGIFVDEKR